MFYKGDIVIVINRPNWGEARVAGECQASDHKEYLLEFPKENQVFHDGVDPDFGVFKEDCPLGDKHYWWEREDDIVLIDREDDLLDIEDLI